MKKLIPKLFMIVLSGLLVCSPGMAQSAAVTVGTVSDGPWERDQKIRALLIEEIRETVGGAQTIEFPEDKRLYGNWKRDGVRAAIDRLMADPEVDYLITLGLLSSYEAVMRSYLAKPVIAARVVAPDLLHVPSTIADGQRVSGVENLSYVTVVGVDLKRAVTLFRTLAGFDRVTFMVMDEIRQIYPDLDDAVRTILKELELEKIDFIYVSDDLSRPLRRLDSETQAVILTPLPQLESGDFQDLLQTLRTLRLPTFTLGPRQEIEAGVMLGINAQHEFSLVAERVASNLKQIIEGTPAASLPVLLGVEESLAVNEAAAAAIGFDVQAALQRQAQATAGSSPQAGPSMSPVSVDEDLDLRMGGPVMTEAELQARQAQIVQQVQSAILRLTSYTAFDSLSFRVEGVNTVTLLGYAFTPSVKAEAEKAVKRIEEVENVSNLIEVLPNSGVDDDIRARVYVAIYGHPSMRRYVPGAGYSSQQIRDFLRDLRVSLRAAQMTRGPHPIHILVKGGNVALAGYVYSEIDKQIAEVQARSVPGVFSIENHLQVVKK